MTQKHHNKQLSFILFFYPISQLLIMFSLNTLPAIAIMMQNIVKLHKERAYFRKIDARLISPC